MKISGLVQFMKKLQRKISKFEENEIGEAILSEVMFIRGNKKN